MNASRKFLLACAGGLLVCLLAYFGIIYWQLGTPTPSSYWCYEMNRRKMASAQAITEPKLLLVGGSGTLFGLKACQIQKELGIPTVNLGTHAALGTDYVLEWASQAVGPGDTVLLCLEYELYAWGNANRLEWAGDIYADYLMARDPAAFRRLPWPEQLELALSVPFQRVKRGGLARLTGTVTDRPSRKLTYYDPELINGCGDLTRHPRPVSAKASLFAPAILARGLPVMPTGVPAIERFCRRARARGARVLATYPNLAYQSEYDSPAARRAIDLVEELYRREGIPIVGSAREAMMPKSEFLDTCYHLNEEAAAGRTARLVQALSVYFSGRKTGG